MGALPILYYNLSLPSLLSGPCSEGSPFPATISVRALTLLGPQMPRNRSGHTRSCFSSLPRRKPDGFCLYLKLTPPPSFPCTLSLDQK